MAGPHGGTPGAGPTGSEADGRTTLLDGLGGRARVRATPRFGTALGAAGGALAVLGGLVLGFDDLAPSGFEEPSSALGTVLMLALVAGGLTLLAVDRDGPLATAGSTTAALALPFLLVFATFDAAGAPPFSVDAVLLVSTAAWALGYLFGPAAGRPLLLGAALVGAWLFVVEQVESALSSPFLLFSGIARGFGGGGFRDPGGPQPFEGSPGFDAPGPGPGFEGELFGAAPDVTTIGLISLLFGIAYLVGAAALDGRGLHGVATPFVVAGVFTLVNGIFALGDEVEAAGVGVLLVGAGFAVGLLGASAARRVTTWAGAAGVGVGLLVLIGDVLEGSSAAAVGAASLVVGGLLVVAAHGLAAGLGEPGELDDRPWSPSGPGS